jgi:hypothetical protein
VRSAGELERLLRAAGLPRAAATKAAAGGWPALSKGKDQTEPMAALAGMLSRTLSNLKG